MSCYVVEKNHIVYLIAAALYYLDKPGSSSIFRTYVDGAENIELRPGDYAAAAKAADILAKANSDSYNYRYPKDSDDPARFLPCEMVTGRIIHPLQVAMSVNCYMYQSCEFDGWEDSVAYDFCIRLKDTVLRGCEGYDDMKWGAPPITEYAAYRPNCFASYELRDQKPNTLADAFLSSFSR